MPVNGTVALVIVLVVALASTSVHAQSDGWRDLRIDGTSLAGFERTVAALQNELPKRSREDFEIALAVIWIRNTLGSGDLDQDGDVDSDDGRLLANDVADLLDDIQSGNILSAIEASEGNDYTAADYLEQLDGLEFDTVLDLAGRPSEDPYFAALLQYRSQGNCGGQREQSVVRLKWCARFAGSAGGAISAGTGTVLNEAFQALNKQQYAQARAAVEGLDVDRLSPYEHSKSEQVLAYIAYVEGKYAEARDHLQNAITAGGLNEAEAADAARQIRDIDTKLAESAP